MRVAYVTTYNAQQIKSWGGGTAYFMAQEFQEQGVGVDYIGPLTENRQLTGLKWRFYRHILKQNYFLERNKRVAQDLANQVSKKLIATSANAVLAPIPTPICYLDCQQPITLWADATFAGLVNFYPDFCNLSQESLKDGHNSEQAALDRCRVAIFSSDWAAKTAVEHYNLNPSKVKVVPYGANLTGSHRDYDKIKNIVYTRPSNQCKLLLLGVDWVRKGGSLALDVAKMLNQAGLETTLTVVGCHPPSEQPIPSYVHSLGFIDKSTAAGTQKINDLLAESHFLILPSRSDCTPMVFGEANSFALPCLTTDVGGIPTLIKNDLNGKTFSLQSHAADYCDYILSLFINFSRYQELALSSFQEYEARLNWSVAVKTVKQIMSDTMS
ncbi:MAG: glycosyltransferase family 4 protein [Timaviella obliquedivisa GSE-PSE-MK23-08B]|nr:glycosyltransferase family 4 protein [Timaviella obliquedivisa GSE-PSE-MK23-08B]